MSLVDSGSFFVSVIICNINRRNPLPRTPLSMIELFDPSVFNFLVTGSGSAQPVPRTCATCDTSDGISAQVIIEQAKSCKGWWHLRAVRLCTIDFQKHVSEMQKSW